MKRFLLLLLVPCLAYAGEGGIMEILPKIQHVVEIIAQFLGAVVVLSSVIVRIIPGNKDDEAVSNLNSKLWKLLSFLPTIGINPRTKALEAAVIEVQGKPDEPKQS